MLTPDSLGTIVKSARRVSAVEIDATEMMESCTQQVYGGSATCKETRKTRTGMEGKLTPTVTATETSALNTAEWSRGAWGCLLGT